MVEDFGAHAFHCIYPTKDRNPREGAYVESAKPRSRVGVTAPPERRISGRVPQLRLTIQFVNRVFDRICIPQFPRTIRLCLAIRLLIGLWIALGISVSDLLQHVPAPTAFRDEQYHVSRAHKAFVSVKAMPSGHVAAISRCALFNDKSSSSEV